MVLSCYQQHRLLFYHSLGKGSSTITRLLKEEGIFVNRSSMYRFFKKYERTACITHKPGSGKPMKITPEILSIVERQMQADNETTAVQLQKILIMEGQPLSLKTILHSRTKLGWTFRGSTYCQLIQDANKTKRLEWAERHKEDAASNNFKDVVWTDESSIQMEAHR